MSGGPGRKPSARQAIIERLRQGPLPSSETEGLTTPKALKVHIHHLRAAGFVIEALPDHKRREGSGFNRAVIYHLIAEPSAVESKGLS